MQYLLTKEEMEDRVDVVHYNNVLDTAQALRERIEGWILRRFLESEDFSRLAMCPMAGEQTNEAARVRHNKHPLARTKPGDCVTCRYCDLCLHDKRIGMPSQSWAIKGRGDIDV